MMFEGMQTNFHVLNMDGNLKKIFDKFKATVDI